MLVMVSKHGVKIRHAVNMLALASNIRHDAKYFVTMSKSRHDIKKIHYDVNKHVLKSKIRSEDKMLIIISKHLMTSKSSSESQKYIMMAKS